MKSKTLKNLIALTVVSAVSVGTLMAGDMKEDAMHDGVMMKHGKMMVMKDGKVKMKDGKTMMMKNGEMVMMDGKMMMMKHGKMMEMSH